MQEIAMTHHIRFMTAPQLSHDEMMDGRLVLTDVQTSNKSANPLILTAVM